MTGLIAATVDLPGDSLVIGVLAIVALAAGWAFVGWDLWRRDDISTAATVAWAGVAVLLAWAGVVLYLLFRPRGATAGERARRQQASDEFVARHTPPHD